MASFTRGTKGIVQKMASAAEEMVAGSSDVSAAATGLKEVVDDFGTAFKQVLDEVRRDLGGAIEMMSRDSATTLREGSEKLESATREISGALKVLSGDVTATMSKVQGSIGDALAIQRKSATEFTVSTQTLNEQIQVTTHNAKSLGEKIEGGLVSVANAGRQMHSIGKNLDRIAGEEGLSSVIPEVTKKLASIEKLMLDQLSVLEGVSKAASAGEPTVPAKGS